MRFEMRRKFSPVAASLFAMALALMVSVNTYGVTESVSASTDFTFTPIEDFKLGASQISSRDTTTLWLIGGGAATFAVARLLDPSFRDQFKDHKTFGSLTDFTNDVLGTGIPGVVGGGAFWFYGRSRHASREWHAGVAQLEALAATGLTSEILKVSVARERPDGSDHRSFPSSHTSTVFASATVLSEFYGWRVGVPLFFLGGVTAFGRVSADKHWLSDTVAGATVGAVIGHVMAQSHLSQMSGHLSRVSVWPQFDGETRLLICRIEI